MPTTVVAATSLCLLKFVATFLRLAAVLTVAFNCLSEILLGLVDTLDAIVIDGLRASHATGDHLNHAEAGPGDSCWRLVCVL
jgi:hypothetical protein